MYWDVTSATYIEGYRIEVCFRDGNTGIVDLAPYIEDGGVFSAIASIDEFRNGDDLCVLARRVMVSGFPQAQMPQNLCDDLIILSEGNYFHRS